MSGTTVPSATPMVRLETNCNGVPKTVSAAEARFVMSLFGRSPPTPVFPALMVALESVTVVK